MALANSISMPSLVVLAMRPRCSETAGSTRDFRKDLCQHAFFVAAHQAQRHLPPARPVRYGSFGLSQLLSEKFSRQQQTNNGGGYHGGSANLPPGKTEVIMGDVSHRYGDHYGRRRTH
jgi:hypothetical protein